MPGIEYLGEDSHDSGYLLSGTAIAAELGAGIGGWAIGKYHTKPGTASWKQAYESRHKRHMSTSDTVRRSAMIPGARGPASLRVGSGLSLEGRRTAAHSSAAAHAQRISGQPLGGSALANVGRKLSRFSKLFGIATTVAFGYDLAETIVGAGVGFKRERRSMDRKLKETLSMPSAELMGGMYSSSAFTQRQRAIQVIHNSQMSTRAAFGTEASYMHF